MGLKYNEVEDLTWTLFRIACWNDIANIISSDSCRGDFVLSKEDFRFIERHWYTYNYLRFVSSKLSYRVDKELVFLRLKDITEDSYVFYMEFKHMCYRKKLHKRMKENKIVKWIAGKFTRKNKKA